MKKLIFFSKWVYVITKTMNGVKVLPVLKYEKKNLSIFALSNYFVKAKFPQMFSIPSEQMHKGPAQVSWISIQSEAAFHPILFVP